MDQHVSEAKASASPVISDYAIIGDCRTAALVSRYGAIDWLCLPDFSDESVFAATLDAHAGGCFRILPYAVQTIERRYLPGTAVLETTFTTDAGRVQVVDFMPIIETKPRALHPDRELVRIIHALDGAPSLRIVFQPRPGYAAKRPHLTCRGPTVWTCSHGRHALLLQTDVSLQIDEALCAAVADVHLSAGEKRYLSLSYSHANPLIYPGLGDSAEQRRDATVRWWQGWCGQCTYEGPYADAVMRSALTLKLLTYALSGAVIAAPTASLPEAIGGTRNWDYRYCWLRDASLTLNAFVELGYQAEGQAFVDWLIHSTRLTWPHLQVMYDINGNTRLHERHLKHLSGYRGSRPVRIGNAASDQVQHDIYGPVVLAAYDLLLHGGDLDTTEKRLIVGFGRVAAEEWQKPDEGIWEYRDGRRHNTYSKVMCWAVLDRLLRLHDRGLIKAPRDLFARARDAIVRAVEEHGYDERLGSYVGAFGGETMDAALLLLARCAYVAPNDVRMRGTFDRLEQQLGRRGLMYRYPIGSDGIDEPEGAFAACGFWAAEYLARRGDIHQARGRMEQLLGYANDVGLFSEEIDPDGGAALGNFPQAFSHSGLINAALAIRAAEENRAGGDTACA